MEATSIPTCSLLWPRQRVLQQRLEDLRHVHGRGHSDPVAARHGRRSLLWEFRGSCRGRSWLRSRKLWRRAGQEPEAANGQHGPQPARPPPAGPPASCGCSQAFPSRCLAGRAWPCASCSTWSHRANPLTESPACYLTLQREVLPQAGSHKQGLPGENSEPAPRPQRACTVHSGTLSRGALVQGRAGLPGKPPRAGT